KTGQGRVGMLEMFNRIGQMAQEERSNAQAEMPALDRLTARFQLLLEDLGNLAHRPVLIAPLGQTLANLLHGTGIEVFPFDQQGSQIDHLIYHAAPFRRLATNAGSAPPPSVAANEWLILDFFRCSPAGQV